MVKVQLEDKDMADHKPYFAEGAHEVYITGAKKVVPETGSPYIEVSILNADDATEDTRNYISEAAAPYTLSKLARIAIHNAKDDAAKAKVRESFKAINDTNQVDEAFLAKFKDMQAWALTEEDLNAPKEKGGYFLRTQLFSWPPQVKAKTTEQDIDGGKSVDLSEIPF